MIQCRACNLWGHFARDCPTKETPQLLCKWCSPGDHEDTKCPHAKPGVNLLSIEIESSEKETLALTRKQEKTYPNLKEEKKRL